MFPSQLLPSYTLATLPAATAVVAGTIIHVTDIGIAGIALISNGTRWRPLGGQATLGVQSADATGTDDLVERIGSVFAIPKGLVKVGDIIRIFFTGRRSDTTDAMQFKIRLGTDSAGLTSTLMNTLQLSGTGRTLSSMVDLQCLSATSILQLGTGAGTTGSYPMATSTADWGTAVTVSDIDANQSYASITQLKGADAGVTVSTVRGVSMIWMAA